MSQKLTLCLYRMHVAALVLCQGLGRMRSGMIMLCADTRFGRAQSPIGYNNCRPICKMEEKNMQKAPVKCKLLGGLV